MDHVEAKAAVARESFGETSVEANHRRDDGHPHSSNGQGCVDEKD